MSDLVRTIIKWVIIIVLFIIGFLIGFRRGAIKQTVTLVGFIFVLILSFLLKGYVAHFFFRTLPFIDFKFIGAVSVLNILFYELLSFLITMSILIFILKVVILVSGIIEKVFKATIILGIISKLIGGILGIIEMYFITFILLFFFSQPFMKITGIESSRLGEVILKSTPILTNKIKGYTVVAEDFYKMKDNYLSKDFEYKSIEKLLKYKVVDVKSLKILKNRNKLNFNELDSLINSYGG